ncbi:TatD family hydrolase [Cellulomonas palmilytica]|uniref:TatD family hydrolase n=1 Tax=Cellulomonas palmilytica TaxID=2608402 RepID=UPI001F3642C8|nr:TatD family hydrolase [Cellulomonas palmilytica]UJP41108.1 TatD family hydrolase [Cellulomonas palmilytica]
MGRSRERGWPASPQALPVPVVDNHTHLETVAGWRATGWDGPGSAAGEQQGGDDEPAPLPGLAAHLARAAAVGVPRMVQVGCDVEAVRWTDAAVREHPALLGAVAIHPNEAVLHAGVHEVAPDGLDPDPQPWHDVPLDEALDLVATTARGNPRIRAVGETGLDFFRAGPRGREVQREAFRAHVALAKELGLALQIHDRDAHDEVVEVLLADGAPERTVFHCFSGGAGLARLAAEHGWFCSFAGPVSFPSNEHLRDAARVLPAELLLVETDAPYLTVHPLRGRPNAPYLLPGTVRALAEARGDDLAALCATLARTSEAVYGTW